jgi:pimeloyl-ACP methyl ester carboxylesterase
MALAVTAALALVGCSTSASPSPAATPSLGSSSPPAVPSATSESTATLLGSADLNRALTTGSYRIGDPFDVPFSIAFPTEWTLKSLSDGDVSFLNTAVNDGNGAAWVTIDRVDTVYDDPCHGEPITLAVPPTVDGLVTALTHMAGFTPGPVSDVVIGDHRGRAVEARNDIDTQTAGCKDGLMLPMWTVPGGGPAATNGGSRENLWVIDVDGAPLLIDGTMFTVTPDASRGEIEQVVQSLRFGSAPPAPVPSLAVAQIAPGLVDIGGRSLFMECRGAGTPTVVFLVGTDAARTQMRPLEDRLIEDSARVCDYDRAGEGSSDAVSRPQTNIEVGDDLAALLAAANIPPPYVLVGQSVGGDDAWTYAAKHPAGVAGLMIMNAGPFVLDFDALAPALTAAEIADERAVSADNLGPVKQSLSPAKGVPYVVMLSTIAQCESPRDICGRIYPFYEAWASKLAERTRSGRYVSVEGGHEIYRSQPARVIEELEQLLHDVR